MYSHTTLLPDGDPVGIRRFFSVLHIRNGCLPLIVTDFPLTINVNDANAGDRPFGIVHGLVIPGEWTRAAQPDEDILSVRCVVHEVRSGILVCVRYQFDRAYAQIRERINDFDIVSGPVRTPEIASNRSHPV